jgi:hypothetical protein
MFRDAIRGTATFNGAAIAGVIALLNGKSPVPHLLVVAGFAFVAGVMASSLAWMNIAGIVAPGRVVNVVRQWNWGLRLVLGSLLCFVGGLIAVFYWIAPLG